MRKKLLLVLLAIIVTGSLYPCSTFGILNDGKPVYGHNLNQGDIGVPGMIFINKRNVFKKGKSWRNLISGVNSTKDFCWISRYGSVTFNNFGRDLPDGGMNEKGLFIWEMSDDTRYPRKDSLPWLNQMSWMQYVLDNCTSTSEALDCAQKFNIDGWGWHFFIGDAGGNMAALEFIDGQTVIHQGDQMPVTALLNEPYEREMELLNYFEGFGGDYPIRFDDPETPRIAKAARLLQGFSPGKDAVACGLDMLKKLKVNDEPEWSVLFQPSTSDIFYYTRTNPELRRFCMKDIDFSNSGPVLILDIENGSGEMIQAFTAFTTKKMSAFLNQKLIPILPPQFFEGENPDSGKFVQILSSYSDAAQHKEEHFFAGQWALQDTSQLVLEVALEARNEFVNANIRLNASEALKADHLKMSDKEMECTFKHPSGKIFIIKGKYKNKSLWVDLYGIEDFYGRFELVKI